MSIMKYKPFGLTKDPFESFFGDMDVFFDTRTTSFVPALDVKENSTSYKVTAELPGLAENDIDLTFKDGLLTLRGEKKAQTKTDDESHVRMERTYGSFQRTISIPSSVDTKAVKASFEHGVLTVTLPKKTEEEQIHKIKIG